MKGRRPPTAMQTFADAIALVAFIVAIAIVLLSM